MSKHLQFPHLPLEIITNILSRLPVRSLLQFKCVSRSWFSLISSPDFAKLQLKQMNENNTVTRRVFTSPDQSVDPEAYCDDGGDNQNFPIMQHNLQINNPCENFEFMGSCNGLICVACDSDYEFFAVFNPTTRQVRELPKLDSTHEGKVFCGFGYDSQIDDYKIVRLVVSASTIDGHHVAKLHVFNLNGNTWRTIQDQPCSDVLDGYCIFLNGALHWLLRHKNNQNEDVHVIVRFDLEEKFLDIMTLPSEIDHANLCADLRVIDECLCVHTHCYATYFAAWKLMDYGCQNSWTKIYQFNNDNFPGCKYWLQLLYVTRTGHLLFDHDGFDFLLYNPKNEKIQELVLNEYDWTQIVYVESLVSPNIATVSF